MLINLSDNLTDSTLNENAFGGFTFRNFYAFGIKRISNRAFGKSAKKITKFVCSFCDFTDSPSNNIWAAFNQLKRLEILSFVSERFKIEDPHSPFKKLLPELTMTIKSNAFQNLKHLKKIRIQSENIIKIEKSAFNFSKSNKHSVIEFGHLNLSGDSFASGSFDGNQRPLKIILKATNITYIPESSFKSVLNSQLNYIKFYRNSTIDCDDCRNRWLIIGQKENQVKNALCKTDTKKKLFDNEIKLKLKTKCKL